MNDSQEKIILEAFKKIFEKAALTEESKELTCGTSTDDMKEDMRVLLLELTKNSDIFNPSAFNEQLSGYIKKYQRILYSEITVYIFKISTENNKESLASFITNIDSVCDNNMLEDKGLNEEITKIAIKIWDHVNLAIGQIENLKMNEQKFAEQAKPIINQLEITKKELEDVKKEHMTQLISIVAIFTALSFVGTGGLSALNEVFNSISDVPLTQALTLGSLSGLIITNMLFYFLYFISKMTGMSICMSNKSNSILVRYPLFFITNIIFLSIFIISFMLYFVYKYNNPVLFPFFSLLIDLKWHIIGFTALSSFSFIVFTLYKCHV